MRTGNIFIGATGEIAPTGKIDSTVEVGTGKPIGIGAPIGIGDIADPAASAPGSTFRFAGSKTGPSTTGGDGIARASGRSALEYTPLDCTAASMSLANKP